MQMVNFLPKFGHYFVKVRLDDKNPNSADH